MHKLAARCSMSGTPTCNDFPVDHQDSADWQFSSVSSVFGFLHGFTSECVEIKCCYLRQEVIVRHRLTLQNIDVEFIGYYYHVESSSTCSTIHVIIRMQYFAELGMEGAFLVSRHIRTSEEAIDPGRIQETKYGNLTYEEIRDRAAEGFIAIVPTGCTEQQGPHLPVDFDTWFAERLMWAVAARARDEYGINALVLPALPFGPTPEHRNFGGGYIDIPKEVHHQMVWAILDSLVTQGFQRILVWRGCGGHDLAELIKRFNSERGTHVHLPEQPYHAIWCRLGDAAVPGGHADSFTTSICLYFRPEDVRMDKITDPGKQSMDWDQPNLDFARHSKTGVIGDPRHATTELGERFWNATVQEATSALLVVNQPPVEANEPKSNQGTMTQDCLFCRIIAGSEPGNIVYSDGDVVVFIPPKPESRVHLILAPRTHITSADALQVEDTGLWMHLLQVAHLLAREHGINVEEEGYHLGTNAGRDTRREFAHLHMWLMNGSQA